MTEFSSTTRFALACNDSTKLIEPIQSRCAIIRFTKLTDIEVLKCLQRVTKAEGLEAHDDGMEALIFTAEGDMRYALNNLQATSAGSDGVITKDNVFKVCDVPHPEIATNVLKFALKGQFSASCAEINKVFDEGYNLVDIVNTMTRVIQNSTEIGNDQLRLNFLKEASIIKMRTLKGNRS